MHEGSEIIWSVSSLAHQSTTAVSSSRLRLYPLRHSVTAAVIRSAILYTLYTKCTLNIRAFSFWVFARMLKIILSPWTLKFIHIKFNNAISSSQKTPLNIVEVCKVTNHSYLYFVKHKYPTTSQNSSNKRLDLFLMYVMHFKRFDVLLTLHLSQYNLSNWPT